MKALRAVLLLALAAAIALFLWRQVLQPRHVAADTITVYYCKADGETLVPWKVTLGPARDRESVAFYATAQALAGPTPGVEAIRFPAGTIARSVALEGDTATIDLTKAVEAQPGGSFAESGEFKALVWTLTELPVSPRIAKVRVRVAGATLATLPGGHLELDEPLSQSSW
jgi:spore germination protein GerM